MPRNCRPLQRKPRKRRSRLPIHSTFGYTRIMRTWILVSDAARARLFESPGNPASLTLLQQWEHPESRYKAGELGADRHSTVTTATGIHGGISQQHSPKDIEIEHFARNIVEHLNMHAAKKIFDRLVLVAPPHFLGLLKKLLNGTAQQMLSATVDKDYTHISDHDMPTALARHL